MTIAGPGDLARLDCPLGVVVDGTATRLEDFTHEVVDGRGRYALNLPLALLRSIASGARVAGRVCDSEWRVDDDDAATIDELVIRIDEELAWRAAQSSPSGHP